MKSFLYTCFLLGLTWSLAAQPVNDDCDGWIDLGEIPACNTGAIYTNIDATASNIGFGNNPSCFNGGTTQRDVWFSFTVTNDFVDVTISLIGTNLGPNGQSILNPQIALYRGDCEVDGLAELSCVSAPNGQAQVVLDVLGLTPGVTYYLRINDYSASAAPNAGDFTLCIDEYVPAINIGTTPSSTACFGTLYDSGGPDANYTNNENHTFTICPADVHACIRLSIMDFNTESGDDRINFFAGPNTTAPLVASLTGVSTTTPFEVLVTTQCVTVQFVSDGSVLSSGFELTWQCSPQACGGSSIANPTSIPGIPFNQGGFSTCGAGATFATTPCTNDNFLNGPEYVFTYQSPGDLCASITVSGAASGTGVLVLDGPPNDPATNCVAQSPAGVLNAVDFTEAGLYYIVVANSQGCTNFNLNIQPSDCTLSPALVDALCNPLNGCINEGGVPSVFNFEDGFQDVPLTNNNDGCWGGVGAQPDYFWFTIQAQADGPFGFILESADVPSDIDFNVWGPFTQAQVCETPNFVVNAVTNTEPIRSSYAGGTEPTGLADAHPLFGYPITDTYDCDGTPGDFQQQNDDVVSTIPAQFGEVYVVLANDWGNAIQGGGIRVDWGPSSPAVLAPIGAEVVAGDTTICAGETVQLVLNSPVAEISWIDTSGTLSCTTCDSPLATPLSTTTYRAVVDAVCYFDTINIKVSVFDLELGPDITLCRGEEFTLTAGEDLLTAQYQWTPPTGLLFSCTDCVTPTITAQQAGTYQVPVILTGTSCQFFDTLTVVVLNAQAPIYNISDNVQICAGESTSLGGIATVGTSYTWSSLPAGFSSNAPNPTVSPNESTLYFLTLTNGECPLPSFDSVLVSVVQLPIVGIIDDITICQGDSLQLSSLTPEADVTYTWLGQGTADPSDPNTTAGPTVNTTYTLQADRLGCVVEASVEVGVTQIAIDIQQPDLLQICLGDQVPINAQVSPGNLPVTWTPAGLSGTAFTLTPNTFTVYTASVQVGACVRADTFAIQVDSLPANLGITADPEKDFYCQGELVTLRSPLYDPADFPNIEHTWFEGLGFQTPDSLYNMVFNAVDTAVYRRITINNGCRDTSDILINVLELQPLAIDPVESFTCPGDTVQLNLLYEGIGEVEWTPAVSISCTDCFNPLVYPQTSTLYTATVTVEGECPQEVRAAINIASPPPPPAVVNAQSICPGESIALLTSDVIPGMTYTWTSPNDPGFLSLDPLLVVQPTATTTYVLNTSLGCYDQTTQTTIAVEPTYTLTLMGPEQVCAGDPVTLTPAITPDNVTVNGSQWSWNNTSDNSIVLTDLPDATTTYTYTADVGSCGQVLIQTITVAVTPSPEVDLLVMTDTVFSGEQFEVLVTDIQGNAVNYSWNPAELVSGSAPNFVVSAPLNSSDTVAFQTYTLTYSTADGCEDMVSFRLAVQPVKPDVPNIFSPNGDGVNDRFRVFSPVEPSSVDIRVFNRWGQMVYEASDNQGWDGNFKGDAAPPDVYIFTVRATIGGVSFERTGELTLLR